jgi:hypothetical protein
MMLKWPFVNKYIFGLLNFAVFPSGPGIVASSSRHAPATSCAAAKPLSTNITNKLSTTFFIIKILSSRRAEYG